jgi:hypothetical protein
LPLAAASFTILSAVAAAEDAGASEATDSTEEAASLETAEEGAAGVPAHPEKAAAAIMQAKTNADTFDSFFITNSPFHFKKCPILNSALSAAFQQHTLCD